MPVVSNDLDLHLVQGLPDDCPHPSGAEAPALEPSALRLAVVGAVGARVDPPRVAELPQHGPDRADRANPSRLPRIPSVRAALPAARPPATALRPLARAMSRPLAGLARHGEPPDRPVVDRDADVRAGDRVLERLDVVRGDPHAIRPALQDQGGHAALIAEIHPSSLRFRPLMPCSSAAAWISVRRRIPTVAPMRAASTFGSIRPRSRSVWTMTSRNPDGWRPRTALGPRYPIETTFGRYPKWRRGFV